MTGRAGFMVLVVVYLASAAAAQGLYGPPVSGPVRAGMDLHALVVPTAETSDLNPLTVLAAAARAGQGGGGSSPGLSGVMSVMLVLTVITLAPSILLMTTCFVRVMVVLGLLRQAIGAQSLPPPQVILALSLFVTLLVMSPTVDRVYREAVVPYQQGRITDVETLWERSKQPLRDFMFNQIEATGNWSTVYMMLDYRGIDTSRPEDLTRADVDMVSLVPAFMLSELKTAFLMGFRVYLPFLVIDMVISTMLISMSMMMLPPVLISLPFKLLLFVLVDGWALVVGSLMRSFAQEGSAERVAGLLGAIGDAARQGLAAAGVA
jgi:flagellar biosynthetic protein FliP